MSSGPQIMQTNAGYTPSEAEVPLVNQGMQQAYSLSQTPQELMPWQNFIGASAPTQAGLAGMLGAAGQQQQMQQPLMDTWQRNMNASDISNNQNVQAMMAANSSQVNDNLQRNIMPGIQQGAIQGGGMNSARQGIAQGVAAGDASQALANANANTQMQAYMGGLGAEQGAMGQAGNLSNMFTEPWRTIGGVGQGVEEYQNRALQDANMRWLYPQQEAGNRLDDLLGRMGSFQYGNNYNVQPNPNYQSPFSQALSIGAGIGGLGMPGGGSLGGNALSSLFS